MEIKIALAGNICEYFGKSVLQDPAGSEIQGYYKRNSFNISKKRDLWGFACGCSRVKLQKRSMFLSCLEECANRKR
jgi:hypothetical protein